MFHLSIVTAEKTIYDGDIEMLVAPAIDGEVGILTNHHPLVTKLGPGGMKITKADKTEEYLFISGGYLEVNNNKATILADALENADQVEKEQAKAARERAQSMIKTAKDDLMRENLEKELQVQMLRERFADVAEAKRRK
ncbi:MAG: ATP synthase F1 subunit epsilon [Candidatus Gracilibacteria bacterium]|jgi:F-type H+-transporting ATPase subunit epsilon